MSLINPEEIKDQSIVCIAELNTKTLSQYASSLKPLSNSGTHPNKSTEITINEDGIHLESQNYSNTGVIVKEITYPSWRFFSSNEIKYLVETEEFVNSVGKLGNKDVYIIATEDGLELSNNTNLDEQTRIEMEAQVPNEHTYGQWGVYDDKSPFTAEIESGDLTQTLELVSQLQGESSTRVRFSFNQDTEELDIETENISVSLELENPPENPEAGTIGKYQSDVLEQTTKTMDTEGTVIIKYIEEMPLEIINTPTKENGGGRVNNVTITRAVAPRIPDSE